MATSSILGRVKRTRVAIRPILPKPLMATLIFFINKISKNYSSECSTNPLLSFGSNHVVFGGIILPVSAISISCFMVTGYKANATFQSPDLTRFSNSPKPRKPPIKSIRLSVRRSLILRIGLNIRSERIVTSSTPIGSLSLNVPCLCSELIPFLIKVHAEFMQCSRLIYSASFFFNRKILRQLL